MANEEWRVVEVLKLLRQCVVCPRCGVLVATEAGIRSHIQWHDVVNETVQAIDDKFKAIDEYVRGDGGLEDRITEAIVADRARLTVIETEITRPVTGIRARLAALETSGGA
jgi:ribosomal protein S27AE